jgi:hypothetical protein
MTEGGKGEVEAFNQKRSIGTLAPCFVGENIERGGVRRRKKH